MKKLFVLAAIAALTACGGSDNKPATDPTTAAPATTSTDTAAAPAAPGTDSAATPAAPGTDAAKPADPAKK